MPQVFNPPPNWPQPPGDWSPTPGWRPDPSWGPAPPGWMLWVEERDRVEAGVRVFISYRRSDAQSQANGLYDGLSHRLPEAKIFMDIDSIPVGADFEHYIRGEIEVCDIVLVLIGDDWLAERPGTGVRRIDEPGDFVRLEIESAFASPRVRVIPVLIEDASMPGPSELPPSLARLSRINAIEVSDKRWKGDLERLTEFLRGALDEERREASKDYAPTGYAMPKATPPTTPAPPAPAPKANLLRLSRPTSPRPPGRLGGAEVALGAFGLDRRVPTCPLLRVRCVRTLPASIPPPPPRHSRTRSALWFGEPACRLWRLWASRSLGCPRKTRKDPTGPLSTIGALLLLASVVRRSFGVFPIGRPPRRSDSGQREGVADAGQHRRDGADSVSILLLVVRRELGPGHQQRVGTTYRVLGRGPC